MKQRQLTGVLSFIVVQAIVFPGIVRADEVVVQPESRPISKADAEYFESRIRPLLVDRCYSCHSSTADDVEGGLLLDSREGILAGGSSGSAIAGRDPNESLLIQAVRWNDPGLQMPPDGRLSDDEIAALERWVSIGLPDPRKANSSTAAKPSRTIDMELGRRWWSFQPLERVDISSQLEVPTDLTRWPRTKVDYFVLKKLADHNLRPSPAARRDVLIRRASLDLIGLRPTYAQVQAFVKDGSDDAYERLIDRLLESPRYGERWGRYWLDVVRYAEDNFTGEATTPGFRFAWRYRDWVIEAFNNDLPYDRFVKLQLAADFMPDVDRRDMVALGFLGAAPSYHKDGRLSKQVVETLYTDDWDERVDAVSRGLLGLTVSCARCHDHKFDPITTQDYYRLAGVFASTVKAPRPLATVDSATETQFMVDAQRVFYLSYAARLLRDDPGSKPQEAREKVMRYREEMRQIEARYAATSDTYPELQRHIASLARYPRPYADEPQTASEGEQPSRGRRSGRRRRDRAPEPLFEAVYDAALYVDGSDPDFTMLDIRPGEARDLNVLIGGNVTRQGARAPRGFLSVLAKHDPSFHHGSGRQELAECIFDDAAPLAARVIVNRVWAWHFGKPLVATPSDFGSQGERPTHPQLLDDLAARFIEHGYSFKWLHRELMLSASYQQSSRPRDDVTIDPANQLLWRMNPRRLDVEAYRDCLLQASGTLDLRMAGPSDDLDRPDNDRRTVYGRIRRGRPASLLQLFDFPSPKMHSPLRETTTSPLQQLFIMNSRFIDDQSVALLAEVRTELDDQVSEGVGEANDSPRSSTIVSAIYRRVFGRLPTDDELQLAKQYLQTATLTEYAQALFATNEVIFWP